MPINYEKFDLYYFYGKPCIRCGETIRYKKRDKQCVTCALEYKKKYREEHREELNAQCREYHHENKDKIKARKDAYYKTDGYREVKTRWYEANKEKALEQTKEWSNNNREKRRQISRNGYSRNKEKEKLRTKKYRQENPAIYKMASMRRRMLEKNTEGHFTTQEWKDLCDKYNNMCLCCKRKDVPLTADHIIPINKLGSSWITNIQPLCQSCNSKKNTKKIDYRPYFSYT